MRRKMFILAVLLIPICLVAVATLAQGPYHSRHSGAAGMSEERMGRVFDRLGLDEQQREQMTQIHEQHRQVTEPMREQVEAAQQTLAELVHAPEMDEAAIRDAVASMAETQADLFVAQAEMFQEVRQILTPEQLEQLEQIRGRHHGMMPRHHGRGHGFHHGCDDSDDS